MIALKYQGIDYKFGECICDRFVTIMVRKVERSEAHIAPNHSDALAEPTYLRACSEDDPE